MKYLATVTGQNEAKEKLQIHATLNFDESKRLIGFDLKGDITEGSHQYLIGILPLTETDMHNKLGQRPNVKIEPIPEDLSFEKFWDTYNHKYGSKPRAERLWMSLPEAEKMKAMRHLNQYEYYLKCNPGIAKAHASTYLNQTRWNN